MSAGRVVHAKGREDLRSLSVGQLLERSVADSMDTRPRRYGSMQMVSDATLMFERAGMPLTDDQQILLQGATAVWVEKLREECVQSIIQQLTR